MWPREHGAWSMLAQPFLCALILSRAFHWSVIVAAAAVVARTGAAVAAGKPRFRCINLYRWCASCDGWNIDGGDNPYRDQILSDLDAAVARVTEALKAELGGQARSAFQALAALKTSDTERVELVNQTIVEEVLQDIGEVDFGNRMRAMCNVALWRNRGDHAPLVGEFAFPEAQSSVRRLTDKSLELTAERTFRITVKQFMDAHTFHEARLRQCCVHSGTFEEDPRRYPFCWRWLFADAHEFPGREAP